MLSTILRPALALAFTALAHVPAAHAQPQAYPSKPLRIIVPFPAGGAQDVLARLIAEPLAAQLKQPVLVENRAGAAGNLGADVLAKAPADGYTFGILSGVHTANAAVYRKIAYRLDGDFAPVKALGDSAVLLAASRNGPVSTIPQFLEYAKTHPGQLQLGSTTSLTLDLLKAQTGLDIQLIPYKGLGEALQDLIGGRLDLVAGPALQMIPMIKEGRIRGLGLASTRQVSELPGVATFAEFVPGYDAGMWYGLFAPAGTPQQAITLIAQQVTQILARPDIQQKLAVQGIDTGFSQATPQQMQQRVQTEIARWREVAAKTGNYAD
jgi:tripartite-type tricarboxylate transporter receptor subunit TctC